MKRGLSELIVATLASAWLLLALGSDQPGENRTDIREGYYSGDYWYDPYYGSSCCSGATIVLPPADSQPPPGLPDAPPPASQPSLTGPAVRSSPGSGSE